MDLTVAELACRSVTVPRRSAIMTAVVPVTQADHIIVRVTLGCGAVGHGEGAPLRGYYWSEESPATAQMLVAGQLGAAVLGVSAANMATMHRRMDAVTRMHSTAKAAIDIACYDALGKATGLAVSELLGGSHRDAIPVAQSIAVTSRDDVAAAAVAVREQGFRTVKFKGGTDIDEDLARVDLIRRAVGSSSRIRMDANGGYPSYADVARGLDDAANAGLTEVEQPLGRWDLSGMCRLARDLRIPVIADESAWSLSDVHACLRSDAADVINIKTQKAGGLFPASRIVALGAAWCAGLMVGGADELGIGSAASLHLAATLPYLSVDCDTRTHRSFVATLVRTELVVRDGLAEIPTGPGLGVVVDDDAIEQFATSDWQQAVRT